MDDLDKTLGLQASSSASARAPLRGAMYDTAVRLISEFGFNAVTIDQIVEEAGAAKGAFYHHWPSKTALLHDIIEALIDLQVRLAESYAALDEDAATRLGDFIEGLFLTVVRHQREVHIFHAELDYVNGPNGEPIRAKSERFQRAIRRIVEDDHSITDGESDTSVAIIGWIIGGAVGYAYRWWPQVSSEDPTEVAATVRRWLLDGLRKSAPA